MMSKYRIQSALLALLVTCAPVPGLAEEPPAKLNLAQKMVFMGEHLRATRQGQRLVYDFRRQATGEPDMNDAVSMTVTRVRDESGRDLSFEFLSGPERLNFPDAQGYRGNPVAVQFLEHDIRGMSKRTGTPVAYFRSRIRRSFKDPQIAETQVTIAGKRLDATEITVFPFAQDPAIAKLDGYAAKEYRFTYSDQVPGHLISIRTRMSSTDRGSLEEELRYNPSSSTL